MGNFNIGNLPLDKAFFGDKEIEKIYFGTNLVWEKAAPVPTVNYFGLQNIGTYAANFSIRLYGSPSYVPNIKYSLDNGTTWNTYTPLSENYQMITLQPNAKILLKGNNPNGFQNNASNYTFLAMTNVNDGTNNAPTKIFGNIMSLIDETLATTIVPYNEGYSLYPFSCLLRGVSYLTFDNDVFSNITVLSKYSFYNFLTIGGGSAPRITEPFTVNIQASSLPDYAFRDFAATTYGSYTLNVSNVTTFGTSSLSLGTINSGDTTSLRTIICGKNITSIPASGAWLGVPNNIKLVLPYSNSDTVSFNANSIVPKGANKNAVSVDIWTDNTTIKDACIAQRDQYTTVHVYYLDGTAWDV